jgi:excisionase family DNA binding protein
MEAPLLWKLEEAAKQLGGVSTRTVQRMIQSGELPSVLVRRTVKVPAASVLEWVERNMRNSHNGTCVQQAVQRNAEKSTCQSAREETRTGFTIDLTPRSGGSALSTDAADRLAAVLGFHERMTTAEGSRQPYAPNGSSKRGQKKLGRLPSAKSAYVRRVDASLFGWTEP